jgi:hypothetical protein
MVEIVQHRDQGVPGLVEVREQVEQLDLMRDVEIGRGLVQEQDRRLLREGHRRPDPLALPAGELVDVAAAQFRDIGRLHRALHGLLVRGAPLPDQPLVRIASACNEVGHRDPVGRDGTLRQQSHDARGFLGLVRGDRLAVEHHLAGRGAEQPGQRAQESGLPARVGTDDDREGLVGNVDREALGDHPVVVGERDIVGCDPCRRGRFGIGHRFLRAS